MFPAASANRLSVPQPRDLHFGASRSNCLEATLDEWRRLPSNPLELPGVNESWRLSKLASLSRLLVSEPRGR